MNPPENIFAANISGLISFQPFHDEIGLPWPLNGHPALKYSVAALFLLSLIQGTKLRQVIVRYMLSPGANLGPINVLIWLDQLNGVCLFYSTAGLNAMFQLKPLLLGWHPEQVWKGCESVVSPCLSTHTWTLAKRLFSMSTMRALSKEAQARLITCSF